jgi:hypothetical protein
LEQLLILELLPTQRADVLRLSIARALHCQLTQTCVADHADLNINLHSGKA